MNFKKILAVVAISFASIMASADRIDTTGYNTNPIVGRWQAINRIGSFDTSFQVNFRFTSRDMGMRVQCYFRDGSMLSAMVSTPVVYSVSNAYDIYIQRAVQAVVQDGQRFCRATLQPTRWTAYFNGLGNMQLIAAIPFGAQFNLVRVR